MGTVPDLGLQLVVRGLPGDPMHVSYNKIFARIFQVTIRVRNIQNILRKILLHDIPRSTGQSQTLALAHSVKPNAHVFSEFLPAFDVQNLAALFAQMKTYELGIFDLSKEANALTILSILVRQIEFSRQLANLFLF